MKSDSLVWIASMTKVYHHTIDCGSLLTASKLLTAIACLQCVERGQLSLDEPVSDILPEYASPQIFTGVDETTNEPIYKPAPRAPALREILTHTSGMGYTTMHPLLQQWCTAVGKAPDITFRSVKESHSNPLVFAPGTGWAYGSGIDWAGKLVERVYNNQRLGAYMKQHILDPLGMTSSTFHPLNEGDGALKERLVQRPMRDPGSGKLIGDLSGLHPLLDDREDDFGGSGLYSCAEDYVEVVKSLLLNDGRLLGRETVEMLFTPGLSKVTRDAQRQALDSPFAAALIPGLPKVGERRGAGGQAVEYEFALGGNVIVNEGGVGGFADKGCLYWSGVANSQWVSVPISKCAV